MCSCDLVKLFLFKAPPKYNASSTPFLLPATSRITNNTTTHHNITVASEQNGRTRREQRGKHRHNP